MARSRYPLTPTVIQNITAFIRAGGFPRVAAEAAGIPRAVFTHWLEQGRRPAGPKRYRDFRHAVCQAQAQARLKAEVAVFTDKPLEWLKAGPGKETPDNPGWTGPVRPAAASDPTASLRQDAAVQLLLQELLEQLAPFPEARAAVARRLWERSSGQARDPTGPNGTL